jgi:hypothetical protein
MSKEEPAWKAELEKDLALALSASGIHSIHDRVMAGAAILPAAWAAILAAEQRGFQAGVNKTGDSVGKLRAKLAAVREELDSPLLHGQDPERQGERWLAQRVRNIINAPDTP